MADDLKDILNALPPSAQAPEAASSLPPTGEPSASQGVGEGSQEPSTATPQIPVKRAEMAQVNVFNPDGELVSIPHQSLAQALSSGYTPASDEDVHTAARSAKYGSVGQQALTALEGASEGATFGTSPFVEKTILGVKPEDIRARREENPGAHLVGETAGLAGSSLLPEGGEAHILDAAGQAASKALIPEAVNFTSKLGSAAVKSAVETALVQGGDEVSKMLVQDPDASVQTALTDVGLAGLMGGAFGVGGESAKALWQATVGPKVTGVLDFLQKKAGGIDGVVGTDMTGALEKIGLTDVAPEVRAGLSNDLHLQRTFSSLNQTDTSGSGIALQKAVKGFKSDLSDAAVRAVGMEPEALEKAPELSPYQAGKKIGETLADEYKTQLDPITEGFQDFKSKYSDIELPKDEVTRVQTPETLNNPYLEPEFTSQHSPGVTSSIGEKVAQLAQDQGWTASPGSEIMREVNRVLKELPQLKTVKDLGNYITAIGDNMQSNPLNGSLRRAGGLIKNIFKEAEETVIGEKVGSEAGAEALEAYQQARKQYASQARLQEALDERLHTRSNASNFSKNLTEMARTDGETVLRRLSGIDDANLLDFLSQNYPKTAQELKNYHVANLLQSAMAKAPEGQLINAGTLVKKIAGLTPEMRNFLFTPEAQGKVDAVQSILKHFEDMPHNSSNTARTLDKIQEHFIATALGLVSLMTGHGGPMSLLVAGLAETLGHSIPDAVKLATLRFMGSAAPIDSVGFKAMADFAHATIKGETLLNRATKNLFKAGSEVLPQSVLPVDSDRKKLDKHLEGLRNNPSTLIDNVAGSSSSYLPDHNQAMAKTATQVGNYLNSIRPASDQKLPLDKKIGPSTPQKAAYNRALDIAQQPLVVLKSIAQGTLTSQDVVHLRNMYPQLYSRLSQKLMDQVTNVVDKGGTVPYKTRLGLSLFLGQPLDSTMTPQAIQAAQPKPTQAPPQQQSAPGAPKLRKQSLSKLPGMYQTPNQAAEADKSKMS